ncbi:MAG TPA: class I SAM-dependent methyltransferase [Usitatibacter sp.]|nr:class I SAM-dependent methyltransferase [Usitatibacter sp.]
MTSRTLNLDDRLYQYLLDHSAREHPVLAQLRAATSGMKHAGMQIGSDQGQFMQLLVRLLNAKRTIEVGVFTGYSSLAVALALPSDGRIIACDVSEEWTSMARKFWAKAGVSSKIDLRLAPAQQTLDALVAEGRAGSFDFAFIDADKPAYPGYYERCLTLLRKGGLVAVDNTLWSGDVADPSKTDENTVAIRAFNDLLCKDPRVALSVLPLGDGVTLALKL